MFKYENTDKVVESGFKVVLDQVISTKQELLRVLAQKMNFPKYFGNNWDALYDCLIDLHWLKEKNIIIMHKIVPNLNKEDLKIYLDILRDSMEIWKSSKEHRLIVYFPTKII